MGEVEGGLDDARLLRYSRHILLDELGIEAQQRLLEARVLILGAGGLGAPAALYLAAAGVGHLTIIDSDTVDLTNLQRQILYRAEDVGHAKATRTRRALSALNPDVEIEALALRADDAVLASQVAQANVVLDCSDNFATRHAVNRACVRDAKPLVSGAALRFDGQVSVFDLSRDDAPCYACLFPDASSNEDANCATMGVFSPLTGIVGVLQAGEALKWITGAGAVLRGRLLLVDMLTSRFDEVAFGRDPECPVCRQRRVRPAPVAGTPHAPPRP